MHKVAQKTYNFNDRITYFIGENGAGKSTILEAIQLALLGYIPGYAKTNESIMKHASSKLMEVSIKLDDSITITRTWIKSGASAKSEVHVDGYGGEIADLLSGIELPILDFNEFKSMTANKLKEWFISFLPSSTDEFNIVSKLEESVAERSLDCDRLSNLVAEWVASNSLSGVDQVKGVNAILKEEQSFIKGQITKLQGTIQSLIKYDDAPAADEAELRNRIIELNAEKTAAMDYLASQKVKTQLQEQINVLKSTLSAPSFEEDPRIAELENKIKSATEAAEEIESDIKALQIQYQTIAEEGKNIPTANATCPYTQQHCDTAAALVEQSVAQREELNQKLAKKKAEIDAIDSSQINKLKLEANIAQGELNTLRNDYDRLKMLEIQITTSYQEDEVQSVRPVIDIDAEIAQIQDILVKVEANKRYDQLTEQVTKDKFALENDLEILKVWIKLTDANGLQTELMNGPFINLAEDMSKYLTQMFGKPTEARFNLEAKANSFSFGLERGGQYLQFDYLSSGERCLFTLALMMCILHRSNSSIRTILIDDILDHLDETNSVYLFDALKKIEDIQFILAGVKECKDSSICFKVD